MEKGALVSDGIINEILKGRIVQPDCAKGFMLDGYPRTLNQAQELDKMLAGLKLKLSLVANLVVSDGLILKRLTNRRVCRKCGAIFNVLFTPPKQEGICDACGGEVYQRADDKEETIKTRLAVYRKDTEPLTDFYGGKGLLENIKAETNVNDIVADLKKLLAKRSVL
jgi:adenylate kinase